MDIMTYFRFYVFHFFMEITAQKVLRSLLIDEEFYACCTLYFKYKIILLYNSREKF